VVGDVELEENGAGGAKAKRVSVKREQGTIEEDRLKRRDRRKGFSIG